MRVAAPSTVLRILFSLVLLVACSALPDGPSASPGPRVFEVQGGFEFRDGDAAVLFYRLEPLALDGRYERSNYVHPLYGLDGEVLTEDFPEDHRHHRGVYWTWHQVWVGSVRAGDPWLAQRFSWRVQNTRILPVGNGLEVTHRWFSPDFRDGREAILEETATVVAHPAGVRHRSIDFDIRLAPLQEGVRLGGSEDDKGYGGFSVRLRMLDDLSFAASSGEALPARTPVELGDWVDFTAGFGQQGTRSGVAVLVHPSSAGYPQPWILRGFATPSMQNPVWPGPDAVALPLGQETRLRYRLVVHRDGSAGFDWAALAAAYADEP